MPGIADVQPKAIEQIGYSPDLPPVIQPIAWDRAQAPDFSAALQSWNQARASGSQANMAAEQAKEYTSPEQIAARQAQTNLAQKTATQQAATLTTADLVKAHMDWYGHHIYTANGKDINYDAEAQSGANVTRLSKYAGFLQDSLTPGAPVPFTDGIRKTFKIYGKHGEDLTFGPDGTQSPTEVTLRKRLGEVLDTLYQNDPWHENTPGSIKPGKDGSMLPQFADPNGPAAVIPSAPPPVVTPPVAPVAPAAPVVMPAAPPASPGEARANLVNAGAMSMSSALQVSDEEAIPTWQSYAAHIKNLPVIQPTAPAAAQSAQPASVVIEPHPAGGSKITVQPAAVTPPAAPPPVIAPPGPPSLSSGGNFGTMSGTEPGYSAPELMKSVREGDFVKGWSSPDNLSKVGLFKKAVSAYTDLGNDELDRKKGITNVKDLALAGAVRRLQQSGAGGSGGRGDPEYQPDKLEGYTPIIEKLYNFVPHILGNNRYDEKTRRRLIELGNQAVQVKEAPARSALQATADMFGQLNYPLKPFFNDIELGLIGQGAPVVPGAGATGATAQRIKLADGTWARMK
jgi:hypothetical protein